MEKKKKIARSENHKDEEGRAANLGREWIEDRKTSMAPTSAQFTVSTPAQEPVREMDWEALDSRLNQV